MNDRDWYRRNDPIAGYLLAVILPIIFMVMLLIAVYFAGVRFGGQSIASECANRGRFTYDMMAFRCEHIRVEETY